VHNVSSTIIADTGLTTDEITRASRHLSVTRGYLLESVSGLSAFQWGFKPADDVWSIVENVEHIVLVESGINGMLEGMSDGPEAAAADKRNEMDEFILNEIPRRSRKGKSPPNVIPSGRWNGSEALQRFVDCRDQSDRLLVTRRLRGLVFLHPLFGPWDGYQWLLASASHGARHTAQIRDVKANRNFPD
jgi:hypothetical protein